MSSDKKSGEQDENNPSDSNNETQDAATKTSKSNSRSAEAKTKLDNLLKSIVKENQEAAQKKPEEQAIHFRLAVPIREKKVASAEESPKTPEEEEAEQALGKEMVSAVKNVAEVVEGDPKKVESELVQKLKTQVGKKINLTDLFAGMKIDRTTKTEKATSTVDTELSRAHRVRRILNDGAASGPRHTRTPGQMQQPRQRRSPPPATAYIPIDLFGAPPLGIFTRPSDVSRKQTTEVPKLETWEALHKRDLKLAVTHPPANGFEEMILWTEQGKLWKFPIDNEQGLDEETKVPFHEHVFLEPQIESWCPKKGPIRHFMELVCVGLSKNPFLTVSEKHQQIEWYHQYFKEKAAIIKEVGAGEVK